MQIALEQLPTNEKISIINALWDSIITDNKKNATDEVPLTQGHKQIISERMAEYRQDGERGEPYKSALAEIRQQLNIQG